MTDGTPHSAPTDEAFPALVQAALMEFVDAQAAHLAPLGPDADRFIAEARASVSGGKRFRAQFCWWGAQAIDPHITQDSAQLDGLIKACAALELLQASALVHDDYIDSSLTRRGRDATHVGFARQHAADEWTGPSSQYGAAAAILVGDALLAWSDQLLRRARLDPQRVNRALDQFDLCRTEVIAGQFLDVSVQARGHADVEAAMTVVRYKAAKYSIERPLHIGACLAGANDAALERLTRFGLPLGEAFQLRDDLLGVFGDPAVTGKPAGDDLIEGKRTVLVALALDAASPADRTLLHESLGRPLSPDEVDRLRQIIDDSGAHAQVEAVISALADTALEALDAGDFAPAATEALRSLAIAATQRSV